MANYLLIDGNSLTYRAFHALPTDLVTASGQVTNAVFGFTSMFIYMVKDQQPDGVLVAFDRPEPTFRHEAVDTYKANRTAAPDILRASPCRPWTRWSRRAPSPPPRNSPGRCRTAGSAWTSGWCSMR